MGKKDISTADLFMAVNLTLSIHHLEGTKHFPNSGKKNNILFI